MGNKNSNKKYQKAIARHNYDSANNSYNNTSILNYNNDNQSKDIFNRSFTEKSNNYNLNNYASSLVNKNYNIDGDSGMNFIVHENDGMNDFIIEMNVSKCNNKKPTKEPKFIIILDKSGSMGHFVHSLISRIIPRALNLLNYRDNDIIHLITFDSYSNSYNMTVNELKKNNNITGRGGTYMENTYKILRSILDENINERYFRICALSDGKIDDQEKTKIQAEKLKTYLDTYNDISISAGSIRFNSGSDNADTRALASVLMLNTDFSKNRLLTEVSYHDSEEIISHKIYELFKNDGFESSYILKSNNIKFRIEPWKEGSNQVRLQKGKNIIFADKNPCTEDVGIYDENGMRKYNKDDFKDGYKINYSNYNSILGAKINMVLRKVRINKTSGSKASLEENKKIVDYFEHFEKNLKGNEKKESEIAKEIKNNIEVDISKYNNSQLAQFIGVDGHMIPINNFLKDVCKIEEREEKEIKDFCQNVLGDGVRINKTFEKLMDL